MSSLAIFGAIFYLYLQQLGFSFLHINLFGGTFWLVNFLTELPAGVFSDRYFQTRDDSITKNLA